MQTTAIRKWLFSADSNPKANAVSMQLNSRLAVSFLRRLGNICRRCKNFSGQSIPSLEAHARERLAVDRFLNQISEPQLSFNVCQKQPATINDALAATQELQSHLVIRRNPCPTPQLAPLATTPRLHDNTPWTAGKPNGKAGDRARR